MTREEFTITAADNGVMLTGEDWAQVIENTYSNNDARYDNLILELGKLFKDLIDQTMNQEFANTVKVKVEITKVED